jgi:hypothetical protein
MRSYEKSDPEKTVVDTPTEVKHVAISSIVIKDAGINYKKEDGIKLQKSFFVIVAAGQKTEQLYFKIISNQKLFDRIKIKFLSNLNVILHQNLQYI